LADAQTIARVVPPGALLLVRETQPGIVEAELFRGATPERQAIVRIKSGPTGPTAGDVALAARALIDGDCRDFSDADLPAQQCPEEERIAEPEGPSGKELRLARRMPHGQFVAGVAIASVGSASLATGYALLLPLKNTAEKWVANAETTSGGAPPEHQRWLNLRGAILYTSVGGGAALVAAMPLALPKYDKPPWWAWLSGGLGVGLAAASVALGVTAESEPSGGCEDGTIMRDEIRTCVRRGENLSFAILLGTTAAPALTVPLVYLFRKSDKKMEPTVEISRGRAYVSVRGRF
jgi:hypothetical protein